MTSRFSIRSLCRVLLPLLACGVTMQLLPSRALADNNDSATQTERPHQLSERASTIMDKVAPMIDGKNWDGAIPLLKEVLAKSDPNSYDVAIASIMLGQVYLQRGGPSDMTAAIPLYEKSLALGYNDPSRTLDLIISLAQLYYQDKNLPKAIEYGKRWLATAPESKWTSEKVGFLVSVLLQMADPSDGQKGKPNKALVEEALGVDIKGMRIIPKPAENLYVLRAIALQQLDRWSDALDMFEVLVARFPKNKQYWQQLYGMYVDQQQPLRALITLERAQALGFMQDKQFNLSRVSLYYNASQYDIVTEILSAGLKNGNIEPTATNYELLGASYQQVRKDEKAIAVYKEASNLFKGGKYDQIITNIYWSEKKLALALKHLDLALKKDVNVESPSQLALFGAYMALELEKYDDARHYLEVADPLIKDKQERLRYDGLKISIEDAASRASKIAAAKAQDQTP